MSECSNNIALYDQLMATFREVVDRELEEDAKFLESIGLHQHTLEHVSKDVLIDWAKVMLEQDLDTKSDEERVSVHGEKLLALAYVGLLCGIQIGHNQVTGANK